MAKVKTAMCAKKGVIKMAKKDGEWKVVFLNGKLAFEGKYIDGNPDGKHSYYFDNGKLREELCCWSQRGQLEILQLRPNY